MRRRDTWWLGMPALAVRERGAQTRMVAPNLADDLDGNGVRDPDARGLLTNRPRMYI
jgi:hypothetical protein